MRIAFDLDDTLIPCEFSFPLEARPWSARLLGLEPLRQGTIDLCRSLRKRGWKLWVYTSSLRNPVEVRLQFLLHGVVLEGIVNHNRHVRRLSDGRPGAHECSKYPPAFHIDLLIDNSLGVWEEGRRFGFHVLVVRPDDASWSNAVLRAAGA
jgi:hypothetical protein